MFVPVWLLIVFVLFTAAVLAWAVLLAQGRNPLPVPDPGSRIFAVASPAAREAVVALLADTACANACAWIPARCSGASSPAARGRSRGRFPARPRLQRRGGARCRTGHADRLRTDRRAAGHRDQPAAARAAHAAATGQARAVAMSRDRPPDRMRA